MSLGPARPRGVAAASLIGPAPGNPGQFFGPEQEVDFPAAEFFAPLAETDQHAALVDDQAILDRAVQPPASRSARAAHTRSGVLGSAGHQANRASPTQLFRVPP